MKAILLIVMLIVSACSQESSFGQSGKRDLSPIELKEMALKSTIKDNAMFVSTWHWATLSEGAANNYSNGTFFAPAGDACGLQRFGVVEDIGDGIGLYTYDGNTVGTPCPSGAKIHLSESVREVLTLNISDIPAYDIR